MFPRVLKLRRINFLRVVSVRIISSGGFELKLDRGDARHGLRTEKLVLAAGPFNANLAGMLGIELPIENFLQRKIVIPDSLGLGQVTEFSGA